MKNKMLVASIAMIAIIDSATAMKKDNAGLLLELEGRLQSGILNLLEKKQTPMDFSGEPLEQAEEIVKTHLQQEALSIILEPLTVGSVRPKSLQEIKKRHEYSQNILAMVKLQKEQRALRFFDLMLEYHSGQEQDEILKYLLEEKPAKEGFTRDKLTSARILLLLLGYKQYLSNNAPKKT